MKQHEKRNEDNPVTNISVTNNIYTSTDDSMNIKKEKSELANLMLQDKNKGLKTQQVKKKEKVLLHCDSMDNEESIHNHH